jgi:CheY-like chemotaxis protein
LEDCYKHIIVADDDQDDIEMFRSAVRECAVHTKVSTAADGLTLINLLQKETAPDAIVLDLNMPRMNGYDCLKAIRKNVRYDKTPVIILSTSNSEQDINYCLGNGANCYIVKPSSYSRLKDIVGDMCKGVQLKSIIRPK